MGAGKVCFSATTRGHTRSLLHDLSKAQPNPTNRKSTGAAPRRVARHLHVDGRTLAALVALAQAEECLHLLPRERLALVRVARALGLGAGAGAEVELVGFLVS